ncbi:hypothetical protein K431DRAFT_284294 [Polychaeton citri CBS 116435]|uniref:N-acetyltransferase domain-containing protein n=1 Tax=Polychaeton citri CBS 116435 TaxID=1314669 RepID=A0A9P4QC46_9PEZI|nr:hypothetical protein K431DRAFT_284294 [Polychaeton citri CBS 116435]
MSFKTLTWTRDTYLISTDPAHLQLEAINAAFAEPYTYWTSPFPADKLKHLLDNSLCIGLYETSPSTNGKWKQIGFRRLITDTVTFAYLTDFYVLPEHRGKGLGKWMQQFTRELLDAIEGSFDRNIRGFRVVTLTKEKNVSFWSETLGVTRAKQSEDAVYVERSGFRH